MGPKTLQAAIVYFSDPKKCREYLGARRWPDGITCPRCGSKNVILLEKYNRWHCREKHDAPQFTLKTGTIMEESPIGVDKWLTAMWQIVNCKNGISSYEVAKAIGVTQKSAWFMDHRIRLALSLQMKGSVAHRGRKWETAGKTAERSKSMRVSSAENSATCTAHATHVSRLNEGTVAGHRQDRSARNAGPRSTRSQSQGCAGREARDFQSEILKNVKYGTKV